MRKDKDEKLVPVTRRWVFFLFQIDWHDPWLVGLIFFHVVITLMTLLTRNYSNFQVLLFLILCKYTDAYTNFRHV